MSKAHASALRAGFTLIELLIALVLVGVGLTALAGTGALVARETRAAASRTEAAVAAHNRMERFLAFCAGVPATGAAAWPNGVRERWVVETDSPLTRLTDSIAYTEYDRRHALAIEVSGPC